MKVQREALLNAILQVKAGLSAREFVEQSSCLVFKDGKVMTFNDEISCSAPVDVPFEGAIQAATLQALLEKLDDDLLDVIQGEGEVEFSAKRKRFGVTLEEKIFLPVDRVEQPEKWRSVKEEFVEAVGMVQHCVSKDETKFALTCVHIGPDLVEACDNFQVMRCNVPTGVSRDVLLRGTSVAHITELGVSKMALTKSWVHFKNPAGLQFSCRRYREDYHKLDPILEMKDSHKITIPRGLGEATDRASVFAADKAGDPLVKVVLDGTKGMLRVVGEGLTGWYREAKKVSYKGPRLVFVVAPALLKRVSDDYTDAEINQNKLRVDGGSWTYVTVLGRQSSKEEETE